MGSRRLIYFPISFPHERFVILFSNHASQTTGNYSNAWVQNEDLKTYCYIIFDNQQSSHELAIGF